MKRKALGKLLEWKTRPGAAPLLLRGARQVGKSYLARELGKTFEQFAEINFEEDARWCEVFKRHLGSPLVLWQEIHEFFGLKNQPDQTLLFLDEIQMCPEAIQSLRYFKEKAPQFRVIAAGSLIDFVLESISFPVGRIEMQWITPLSFSEYLEARGKSEWITAIRHAVQTQAPLSSLLHESLNEELDCFSLIGGMPAVVRTYLETEDLVQCQSVTQNLVSTYRMDFFKYATKAKIKYVQKVFDGIPRQIGNKFVFSHCDSEVKSRDLSEALDLLEMSGVAIRAYHSAANGVPLAAEIDEKRFKVFLLDIGLVHRVLGLELSKLFQERTQLLVNRGGVAEQWVAQHLVHIQSQFEDPKIHYWQREVAGAQAEVDFVWSQNGKVYPIEVKSGSKRNSKSLSRFLEEKKLTLGVTLSRDPLVVRSNRIECPFYMTEWLPQLIELRESLQ